MLLDGSFSLSFWWWRRRREKIRQASSKRTRTAPTTIPAIAPSERLLWLGEDVDFAVPVDVGRTDGMAITSAAALFSKTHCETLKVRLL